MKGQTLKLGSLGRTLEISSKKQFQRLVVDLALSLSLLMVVLSWVLLVFLIIALLGPQCSWLCFLGFYWCSWFLLSSALFGVFGHHYSPMLYCCSQLLLSWVVGVPSHAFLGFVWCLWLCFPRALLLLVVMFSRALLMFVVVILLGFVGVCGCCSFGFLVFVVVVLLGFVGIFGHVFLDSWCSWLCFLGFYWCSWSLLSWVMYLWSCYPCFYYCSCGRIMDPNREY